MALYDLSIKYKAGKTNINANALSHIVWDREIPVEGVNTMLDGAMNGCSHLVEMCAIQLPEDIPQDDPEHRECQALAKACRILACMVAPLEMSTAAWAQAQWDDPELLEVIQVYQKSS